MKKNFLINWNGIVQAKTPAIAAVNGYAVCIIKYPITAEDYFNA